MEYNQEQHFQRPLFATVSSTKRNYLCIRLLRSGSAVDISIYRLLSCLLYTCVFAVPSPQDSRRSISEYDPAPGFRERADHVWRSWAFAHVGLRLPWACAGNIVTATYTKHSSLHQAFRECIQPKNKRIACLQISGAVVTRLSKTPHISVSALWPCRHPGVTWHLEVTMKPSRCETLSVEMSYHQYCRTLVRKGIALLKCPCTSDRIKVGLKAQRRNRRERIRKSC